MSKVVTLQLNQQQIELLDNTLERVGAATREELVRRALRDLHADRRDRTGRQRRDG